MTIDNDGFVYAEAYARALHKKDEARGARIGDDYLRYMDEVFAYYEDVSRRAFGREIPQVLLLHANSLNADRFDALAEALVRRDSGAAGVGHRALTWGAHPVHYASQILMHFSRLAIGSIPAAGVYSWAT